MPPLISPSDLVSLRPHKNFVLIDARNGPQALQTYQEQHLDGALFVDLDADLSQKNSSPAEGGRHPLPPLDKFLDFLGQLGITRESHVVVYDDKNGANAAARFWWMMRAVGHRDVQVLDGGYQAALAISFPTSSNHENKPSPSTYQATDWTLPLADVGDVEKAAQDPDHLVIDVRDADRFRGEREPIDRIAGHIPGAVNIPFSGNLDGMGFFLPPETLRIKYTTVLGGIDPSRVIVHCGSGVTACHTLLAMEQAGMELPKLYVGSWSEWSESGRAVGNGA